MDKSENRVRFELRAYRLEHRDQSELDNSMYPAPGYGLAQTLVERHRRTKTDDARRTIPGTPYFSTQKMKLLRRGIEINDGLCGSDQSWRTLQG
ncbi:MAG: hypothetical protein WBP52_06900, partial [Terriglobales bacterium]